MKLKRHRVFISYSHKDQQWLKALQVHLRPLEREGRITRWDDTLIQSGSQWREEIKKALEEARVAVLLVSKHFLASDFIADDELPPLLQAAETEGATILPILIGPCRFTRTQGLSNYQAVNSPDRTLLEMDEAEQDRVWLTLTYKIEDLLAAPLLAAKQVEEVRQTLSDADLPFPISGTIPSAPTNRHSVDNPSPDLYILVHQGGEGEMLSFQLKAKNSALGLDDRLYGPVVLSTNPRVYFGELFRDIENLPVESEHEREVAGLKLEIKGCYLFENILPNDLQEVLWSLRGKIKTVLIQSDEGIIPWELFKFSRKGERGPFFCEEFALSRWITGYEPKLEFPLENVAWISTRGADSADFGDDPQRLEALGHSVTKIPATFLKVHDALASGEFDGLHFATHSSHAQGPPGKWKLYLEDYEELSPEDLVGAAGNLGATRPLVFLNACHSGLNAETIVGVSGWATQFIRAGCGAFIGSYWNLRDRVANSFQESFYRHFLGGLTLGEAARHARLEVCSSGDPTWLSYTVYGHPEAKMKAQTAEGENLKKSAGGGPQNPL